MKKILFIDEWPGVAPIGVCAHGLGGSLFKLAGIADAAAQGFICDLLTSSSKVELLLGAKGINALHTQDEKIDFSTYDKLIILGIVDESTQYRHDLLERAHHFTNKDKKAYKDSPHISFWRLFIAKQLDYSLPQMPAQMQLVLNDDDSNKIAKLLDPEFQWIALSYQVISILKDYAHWDEVINSVLEKNPQAAIVLLGDHLQDHIGHPRLINLMGKTSIEELKALAAHCQVVVGNDGLLTNLGMVMETPTVVLFSMIAPTDIIDEHQHLKSPVKALVKKGCPHQFCYSKIYNYRNAGCLLNKERCDESLPIECLQFDPLEISQSILDFL